MFKSAMMSALTRIASLKLTLVGIVGVIGLALASSRLEALSTGWVAVPLAVLAANLLAAILVNGTFRRQSALLVFHVCLLAVILLIGVGVLTRFDGQVEVVEGERFDAANIKNTDIGRWHPEHMDEVVFTQGDIEVSYLPGLIRRDTRSELHEHQANGNGNDLTIGDRVSASFSNYRFVATMNKGYALIALWTDGDDEMQRGSINFPSFPEYEWKQAQDWTTPGGEQIFLELKLSAAAAPRDESWTLTSRNVPFAVEISGDGFATRTLQPGDSTSIGGGTLGIEELRMWMGYRIDYSPALPWVFSAAMLALLALAAHFQTKYWPASRQAGRSAPPAGIGAYDGCD